MDPTTTPTPVALSTHITNVGSVVTAAGGWLTSTLTEITKSGNEILLLPFYLSFLGVGFGLVKRAMRVFR